MIFVSDAGSACSCRRSDAICSSLMRPPLKVERARGVDAEHRDLVVDERGLEVGVDVALVVAERAEEALPDVVERHVVVAGHHQLRHRQPVEEGARLLELRGAGALREVARDGDELRRDLLAAARSSGSISAGSMRPKCRSERWTRVRMRRSSHVVPLRRRGHRHLQAGRPDAIASGVSHLADLAVGGHAQPAVPALDDEIARSARPRSRAPAAAGRTARAAPASAGAAGPARCVK